MDIVAPDFPVLDKDRVEFDNKYIANDFDFAISPGEDGEEYSDIKISNVTYQKDYPSKSLLIHFIAGGGDISCRVSISDATILLKKYLEDIDFLSVPLELIEAAVEKEMSVYQNSMNRMFGHWIEVESVSLLAGVSTASDEGGYICVEFTYANKAVVVYFDASEESYRHLFLKYCSKKLPFSNQFLLNTTFSFGKVRLLSREIELLDVGDVIFFDACYFEQNRQLSLAIEGVAAWIVTVNKHVVEIVLPWSNTVSTSDTYNESESYKENNNAVEIDSLKVDVSFDMAEQRLSLQEVQSLAVGYVFDLQINPDEAITVSVNGQSIGQGELVSVGGKLGVRLTSLRHG